MPQYSGMWTLKQVSQAVKNLNWTGIPPSVIEYLIVAGGGGGGGNSFLGAVAFLASMGGGGGGGNFLSPSFTISGGVNWAVPSLSFCFLGLLLTVTGMASGPFSITGFDFLLFTFELSSCALEKSPIPNRQKAVSARRRFMAFFYNKIPNVINSIKPVSKSAKIGSIAH